MTVLSNRAAYLRLSFVLLAVCSNSRAQGVALSLSSASATPGQSVVLTLSSSATGTSPDSLQWTLNYSATDFTSASFAPAAGAANKTLTCTNGTGTATCLVWGLNSSSIPNNVAAQVTLTLAGSTSDSSSSVQLTNGVSASSSGVAIPTTVSGGTVTIQQTPVLSSLSCSPTTLTPSVGSTCTVSLTSAALSGGATIGISVSPTAANVPSSVTIPQGSTSTTFSATAGSVTTATSVTLTASYSGVTETFGVTVDPPPPALSSVSVSPSSITSGLTGTGTVTLTEPAGTGGVSVSLSSSSTAVASVPSSMTVAQGATSATFTVSTGSVTASSSATLTASYSGVNMTSSVTVNPLPGALNSISVSPSTITSGQSGTGTVTLTAAAGTGGATVSLSSSNTAAAGVPSSVTIPQGSTSSTFTVSTGSVSTSTPATLTASYSGVNQTASVTVNPFEVPVSFSSYYNREGIVADGSKFHGGVDGNGFAYSSNLLGTTASYNGSSFTLGAANGTNVVSGSGETIALPSGAFTQLNMLATAVNGRQKNQTFIVTYTDGSTSVFTQSLSDWAATGNEAGETTVKSLAYRDRWNGTTNSTTVSVYGYTFAFSAGKTASSITLPTNADVIVLALTLGN